MDLGCCSVCGYADLRLSLCRWRCQVRGFLPDLEDGPAGGTSTSCLHSGLPLQSSRDKAPSPRDGAGSLCHLAEMADKLRCHLGKLRQLLATKRPWKGGLDTETVTPTRGQDLLVLNTHTLLTCASMSTGQSESQECRFTLQLRYISQLIPPVKDASELTLPNCDITGARKGTGEERQT